MKHLSILLLAGLFIVSSAFVPVTEPLYTELLQSFKQLKKSTPISNDRQDDLGGIQQLGIVAKGQKHPVLVELMSNDGFSAPIAKAVLKAAMAANGITDVKVFIIGTPAIDKVAPVLNKLGFKVGADGAKYNDQSGSITFESTPSNPQAIHVLLNENAATLLTNPDKFAVKLKYPSLAAGSTDEQYQKQANLIAAEMLFVVARIKDNWKF